MKNYLSAVVLWLATVAPLLAQGINLRVQPAVSNQVQLTWQSSSNLSEELQHSPNLVSWQIVMRPYPAQVANSTLTNVLASTLPNEFFRLQFSTLTNTPVPTTPGVYPGLKLVSGGLTRSYRLFIPPSYSPTNFPAAPLAVILHGHGQTADGFAALHPDLFSNVASNGMILVLPDGTLRDSTTSWMDSAPRPYEANVHDTQFILDLVNVLKCALSVDNLRVYAGGFSNGGQMVHQLGIQTTNTFAALACVAAAIAGGQGSTNPVPPPGPSLEPYPVLIVNASNDCVRPYYGGINIESNWQSSALSAAVFWVTNNGCTTNVVNYFVTTSVATNGQIFRFQTDCYPPKAANTNSLVTNSAVLARFNGCGFGKVVEFVSLTDGGHNWPDANDNVGFDANAAVIAFFLQHARTNYVPPTWTGLQQFSVTSPIQNGGTFSAQLTLQNPGASIIPCGYLVWLNPNLNILKFTSWNTPVGSTVVTNGDGDLQWSFDRVPGNTSLTLNLTGMINVIFGAGQEFSNIVSTVRIAFGENSVSTNLTIKVLSLLDYGDAPATYPTLFANNGARHAVGGLRLGASVDVETNGVPSVNADGDDNHNLDDENGVQFLAPIQAGQLTSLAIFASAPGYVDAWVDYNRDGTWTNGNEQIFASLLVSAGSNNVSVLLDSAAAAGKTYWRFRLSSAGGLAPDGFAPDGEVEDYATTMLASTGSSGNTNAGLNFVDWGDAPAPYPTLAVQNGASHHINDGIRLGVGVDAETNGQPQINALGDDNNGDDEDGVVFGALTRGAMGIAQVNVNGGGFLNAWIDFNGDGDWNDAGEQIATSKYLITGGNPNPITFLVPANATTNATFARFRFGVDAAVPPTGGAGDGEVEDYRIVIP